MKTMTLEKILQSQGIGTRNECRALIHAGEVSVGGKVVDDSRADFEPEGLEFTVAGKPWRYRRHIYIALNKPEGYECSRQPSHHLGVLLLLPHEFLRRGVQPVGRLDHDTTGLLLLSDDGQFIHRLSSPKYHVPKVYRATTADPVDSTQVRLLLAGVLLKDESSPLAALECRQLGLHEIEITLAEGKYHQVKRMLAAAGNHCESLHRVAIGGLRLEALELSPGRWRYLDEDELSGIHR
jgi:16S rRNA pseudouridine516 synthase